MYLENKTLFFGRLVQNGHSLIFWWEKRKPYAMRNAFASEAWTNWLFPQFVQFLIIIVIWLCQPWYQDGSHLENCLWGIKMLSSMLRLIKNHLHSRWENNFDPCYFHLGSYHIIKKKKDVENQMRTSHKNKNVLNGEKSSSLYRLWYLA